MIFLHTIYFKHNSVTSTYILTVIRFVQRKSNHSFPFIQSNLYGDRTEPPRTCTPRTLTQRTHTPWTLTPWTRTPRTLTPKDTYSLVTYPLDNYPLDTYPLGHIPPRTYTPKTLKCPICFMHHVLITYCTLKNIYLAEFAFTCDVGAIKLTDICSTQALSSRGGGGEEFCPCQLSILISILLACYGKFQRYVPVLFAQGVSVQGVSVPGGLCPRG